jgi:tetratricopeptide (TPR) repeat protein
MINCPYCGKLTDPKLDSCVHCGGYLHSRAAGSAAAARGRQTCPNCQAEVEEGAILCVACGTNLLTGQKISEERRPTARRRRWSPGVVGAGIAAAAVLGVIILVLLTMSREAVGEARQMIAEGNLLGAQEVLRDHVRREPDDRDAQMLLGKVELRNNQAVEAARSFERAAELDRRDTDALRLAVMSYATIGDRDPTSRGKQITALEKLVERQPGDAEAWYLLALARGAQGNAQGQAEALRRAVEIEPNHPGVLRELGIALALQGDHEEAHAMLTRAEAMAPEAAADTHAARGFVAALQDDTQTAIGRLTAAVASQTAAQEQALTQLGIEFIEMGRFAEAQKHLAQAVNLGGRNVNAAARFFHGVALRALGRPDEALAEFDILAKAGGPYQVDAAVQGAQVFLERGNVARARETLESVGQQAAGDAGFYTTRGRLFVLNDEDARAQEAFQQAIQNNPRHAAAYLELGLLRLKNGQFGEALQQLSRYLELIGEDAADPQVQQIRTLVDQLRSTVSNGSVTGLATLAPEAGQ